MNRDRKILLAVTVAALIARAAAFVVWPELPDEDTDGYLGIAKNLVQGNGYANGATGRPTAFRPPLFPLLIAVFSFLPLGFQLLQLIAGTVSVWLAGIIGERTRIRLPWLPAAVVAFDPILIAYTPRAMTEVISALTIALLLWVLSPSDRSGSNRQAFVVGCLFGLAALCRPTILALLPFAVLLLMFAPRDIDGRAKLRRMIIGATGVALFILPWTLRNAMAVGSPVFATTHGGYTLLLGNNPEFYKTVARGSWKTVWDSLPWQAQLRTELSAAGIDKTDEVAVDQWMYQRARSNISADQSGFAAACVVRVRRFWNLAPLVAPRKGRTIILGMRVFYVLVFTGLIATVFRRSPEKRGWFFLIAASMLLAFTLVHAFYWSNTRMRAPLTVPIALLSARGWVGFRKETETVET